MDIAYYTDDDSDEETDVDSTLCESCFRFSCGVFREGYNVCEKCGNVKEMHNIDQSAEWNNYTSTDGSSKPDNSRCGFTDTAIFKSSNLSTTVRGNSRIAQMVLWGSISHKDSDMFHMNQSYTKIAETVGFGVSVVNKACKLYRQVTEKNITRQNVRDGIVAAALFQALSSETDYSYTISDVAKWFGISAQSASAGNAAITSVLFRESDNNELPAQAVQITQSSDIIERYGNLFQFSYPLKMDAQKMCRFMQKRNEFYGTHGSSLAAGIVYYFIREKDGGKYHIKEVSERTDVSSGTIKKIYNSIQKIIAKRKKN